MKETLNFSQINIGPFPKNDGWNAIYRMYQVIIKHFPQFSSFAQWYFLPNSFEMANERIFFKRLGVDLFGRIIPTGGILIRRLTGAKMKPYTLASSSYQAAREFFFRTCIFEALHLPFFLTLVILSTYRLLDGRPDLAGENMLINLFLNLYPILHHRNTRARIIKLLHLRKSPSKAEIVY